MSLADKLKKAKKNLENSENFSSITTNKEISGDDQKNLPSISIQDSENQNNTPSNTTNEDNSENKPTKSRNTLKNQINNLKIKFESKFEKLDNDNIEIKKILESLTKQKEFSGIDFLIFLKKKFDLENLSNSKIRNPKSLPKNITYDEKQALAGIFRHLSASKYLVDWVKEYITN